MSPPVRRWVASLSISGAMTAALLIGACSSKPPRREPGGYTDPTVFIPTDLSIAAQDFLTFVNSEEFRPESCGRDLSDIYDALFSTPAVVFDRATLQETALAVIRALFDGRLSLRRKLADFERAPTRVPDDCLNASRAILRAGRTIEDMVGEWRFSAAGFDPENKTRVFQGTAPWLLRADGQSGFNPVTDLRSGDILLSRGDAFTSAAIARLGDQDSQFSHSALVYVEPPGSRPGEPAPTGAPRVWTIEAHLEIGVVAEPIEKYLTDGKVRSALYRHPDAALAHRAAELLFRRARQATAAGANIPYDFGMRLDDTRELFCSEVPRIAFAEASSNALVIPYQLTRFDTIPREFVHRLGIQVQESFLPGDLDVDGRFELIAEWRDLNRMRYTRIRDSVLTAMYDWMRRLDYRLQTTLGSDFAVGVLHPLRRWPLFSRALRNRFPENMPRETLGTIVVLDQVALVLYEEVERLERLKMRESGGVGLSPKEMLEGLDRFRVGDAQRYRFHKAWLRARMGVAPERSRFHAEFRPEEPR